MTQNINTNKNKDITEHALSIGMLIFMIVGIIFFAHQGIASDNNTPVSVLMTGILWVTAVLFAATISVAGILNHVAKAKAAV